VTSALAIRHFQALSSPPEVASVGPALAMKNGSRRRVQLSMREAAQLVALTGPVVVGQQPVGGVIVRTNGAQQPAQRCHLLIARNALGSGGGCRRKASTGACNHPGKVAGRQICSVASRPAAPGR
jgi:hypothetical protein